MNILNQDKMFARLVLRTMLINVNIRPREANVLVLNQRSAASKLNIGEYLQLDTRCGAANLLQNIAWASSNIHHIGWYVLVQGSLHSFWGVIPHTTLLSQHQHQGQDLFMKFLNQMYRLHSTAYCVVHGEPLMSFCSRFIISWALFLSLMSSSDMFKPVAKLL